MLTCVTTTFASVTYKYLPASAMLQFTNSIAIFIMAWYCLTRLAEFETCYNANNAPYYRIQSQTQAKNGFINFVPAPSNRTSISLPAWTKTDALNVKYCKQISITKLTNYGMLKTGMSRGRQ